MVCDEENVPLLQRKNQLTRRLRSLKKQKAKCCKEAEAAGLTCTKKCDTEVVVNAGDHVEAEFEGLGSVSISFT